MGWDADGPQYAVTYSCRRAVRVVAYGESSAEPMSFTALIYSSIVRSDALALHDTTEPTRPQWQATIRDDKLHHPAAPKASDGPLPRAATRSSARAEHDDDGSACSDASVSATAELHAPIVRDSARPRQHDETASAARSTTSSGLRTDLEQSHASKPPPPHAASPMDHGNRQPKPHERSADLHMHAHTIGAAPTHAAAVGSHLSAAAHPTHVKPHEPAAHLKAATDNSLAAHAGLAAFAQRSAAAHRPAQEAIGGTAGGARLQDADRGGADEQDSGWTSSGRPKQVRCEY
jgi:hypothetical protein